MKEFCDVEHGSDGDTCSERLNLCCDTVTKRRTWYFVIFCVLLSVAVILGVSIKRVESTELGVVYDVHTKQLNDAVQSGVLHVGPPG